MSMLNCFLISNMYPTQKYPGYGSFVKNVCDGLSPLGIHTIYKAVIRGRATSLIGKIFKYIQFYYDIAIYYFRSYDFIYLHFPNHAVPILSILMLLARRKVVVNFHGEDLLYNRHGFTGVLGRMMEHFCRRYASAIVVPSEYFAEIVRNRNIITPNKIIVSPSGGINSEIFFASESYNDGVLHLGYVGRLEREKGVWEALYSCELVRDRWPVDLTIIGYGSCYNDLLMYIESHNLSKIVKIIHGVAQKDLGRYYRNMNLFLFSSRLEESLGLTGIEAMACGVPVIGSNIGGIATYVRDGKNGFLVKPANVDDIVNSIEKYQNLSDGEKRSMRKCCIESSKQFYSSFVMKCLYDNIQKLINNI